jgi:hypothetical protein
VLGLSSGLLADKAFWMADGQSVIFRGRGNSVLQSIYTVPAAGGMPRQVAALDSAGNSVRGGWAYSPGRMYVSLQEQQSDISVLEVER